MKNLAEQINKFTKVTFFIFKQYLKIFYSYKDVQYFFTDMYIRSRTDSSFLFGKNRLPICTLEDLFPRIKKIDINIYAQYKSLTLDLFSKETNYLVSPKELFALSALVKFLEPKTVFEIGTYKGWTLANLSLNLPKETQIYSIDLGPIPPENNFIQELLTSPNIVRFYANTYEFNFDKYEGLIDFIFIDAGHERKDVMNDTIHALKMLSPNGTIVWHDYNFEHKGVYDYLHELKCKLPIKALSDTSLAIYSRNELYSKG